MKSERRTPRKSAENKAVRKMLSMRGETWAKADRLADARGTTRSALVASAIEMLWKKEGENGE